MKKISLFICSATIFTMIALTAGCSSANNAGANGTSAPAATGKSFGSGPAGNNLTATLASADGVLKKGKQEFTLSFTDAAGKPVDVGSAALNFRMPAMGSMAEMNNGATFTKTSTPGVYRGNVEIEMVGDWQAQITYEGPAGKGAFSLPVVAK